MSIFETSKMLDCFIAFSSKHNNKDLRCRINLFVKRYQEYNGRQLELYKYFKGEQG